jgi:two-component system, OmpR family, response regulator
VGKTHIEIVEGNPHLRSLLGWHLQQSGYTVHLTSGIRQAREVYARQQPDIVVVDTDVSDGDGLDFCRWLYRQQRPIIMMLSASAGEVDVVEGLKSGADDFLKKPFGIQEFLARAEALSRRCRSALPIQLRYGELRIDLVQRRVHYNQELVDLTPQEFSLLYILVQAEGVALSRLELLQRAWPENIDNPRTVDTHVLSLRKKLELDPQQPQLIQTVRNVGYRLNLEFLSSQTPNGWARLQESHTPGEDSSLIHSESRFSHA